MDIERIETGPTMSQAVIHGDHIYLAGLVAGDLETDTAHQTKQILDKIDSLLAQAGSDKSRILKANIWLIDIGEWAVMNEVWKAWAAPGATPARATVEARLANPKARVEIMVEAVR